MEMVVWLCACLALLATATAQTPHSPCPSVFSYEQDNRMVFGYIRMPDVGNTVRLKVSISSTDPLSGNVLEPVSNRKDFRVNFPNQRRLPIVNWISVNDRQICANQQGIPSYYNHRSEFHQTTSVGISGNSQPFGGYQPLYNDEVEFGFGDSPVFTGAGYRDDSLNNRYGDGIGGFGQSQYRPAIQPQNQPVKQPQYQPAIQSQYQPAIQPQYQPAKQPQYQPQPAPVTMPTWMRPATQRTVANAEPTSAPAVPAKDCGLAKGRPAVPLIYFGMPITHGEWPWLAAVYLYRNNSLICGGSLVDLTHVVTAAHCVVTLNSGRPRDREEMYVVLGKFDLTRIDEEGNQEREIRSIRVHGDYDHDTKSGDIALIELDAAVEYTDYVRPICLWKRDHNIKYLTSLPASVVGWGHDEMGHLLTDQPKEAYTPIVTQRECINSNRAFFESRVNDMTLCAGNRNGSGPCRGDSGGGLMIANRETDDDNVRVMRYYLQGVVSLGQKSEISADHTRACNLHEYVIYTNVNKYLGWLRKFIVESNRH